jgi:hypothetical protein
MILENLMHSGQGGKVLDGMFISMNCNRLIFENEWSAEIGEVISKAILEEISAN